ncbi:hypothetical protein HZC27_01360 [Candidatus Roizmanbacteria bacterium]|nr:hypothetical protein [Candidatus Roizmanbacteria bacterium]
MDRFIAALYDEGIVHIILTPRRFPAKSVRNILIAGISLLLLGLHSWLVKDDRMGAPVSFFLFPIMSFICVLVGVYITSIFAHLKRESIIKKASILLSQSKVTVIGVTGSYGKTTTKEYLYEILSTTFKVAKTDENMNSDVGVALSILKNLKPDTQYFIAEMGAYRVGEIKKICDLVKPTFGIITAIGNQHVGLFGSRENIIKTKVELLEALPVNGCGWVNADSLPKNKISKNVKSSLIFYKNGDNETLPGITPCVLLAQTLGMSKSIVSDAIANLEKKVTRTTPVAGIKQSVIIDNSYNTSVEGCIHTIQVLGKRKEKRKILVTRGIIELGSEKRSSYDRILKTLNQHHVSLYTTDIDFNLLHPHWVHYFSKESRLSESLLKEFGKNTVVAFEGKYDKKFIAQVKI